MEIKNLDDLRAAYPDLLAQAECAAQAKGCMEERARMQGIEDIQAAVGDAELVRNAKYGDTPMNAEQLAFAAMKAQAAVGATVLGGLLSDTQNSGAASVVSVPTPAQEQPKDEDAQAVALMASVIKRKEGK